MAKSAEAPVTKGLKGAGGVARGEATPARVFANTRNMRAAIYNAVYNRRQPDLETAEED